MMPRAIYTIGVCLLMLAFSTTSYAVPPAAGSFVTNQASSTFVDTKSGLSSRLSSNVVSALILPLPGVQLTTPQVVQSSPGTMAYLFHTLTNSGNTTTDYTLTVSNQLNDGYDLSNLRVVQDTNGNGIAEAAEPVLTPTTAITLPASGSMALIVSGVVPATVGLNVYGNLTLTAVAVGTAALTVSNLDAVYTQNGAIIGLNKTVDIANAQRNDVLTYTLTAQNTGVDAALGTVITVDGYSQQSVLIYDQIPANTSFVQFITAPGGQMLYHSFGAAAQAYTSLPPAALTSIDAIAVAYPDLQPDTLRSIQFSVKVNQNASGAVNNTASVHYFDKITTAVNQQPSNQVQTGIALVPPTITYYRNNQYNAVADAVLLGSPLFLQADAASCNLDPVVVESKTIVITSALTNDTEQFTLVETGPNTGVFHLSLANVAGIPTRDAKIFPVSLNNGIIESLAKDTLTAALNGCGTTLVTTKILIDPAGCTFDSQTGAGIPGATVSLIDVTGNGNGGVPGGLATVLAFDAVTPVNPVQVTDSYGCYQFPLVQPSTYKLTVVPPAGYTFPSTTPVNQLPAGRTVVGDPVNGGASYGGAFTVALNTGAVYIDFPLDSYAAAIAASGFVDVYKQVNATTALAGSLLTYTLTASNTGLGHAKPLAITVDGAAASMVVVRDVIPANTTFSSVISAVGATVLYHTAGAPMHQYTTVAPVLASIDAIAFGYAAFPPTTVNTITFQVSVNANAAGSILNFAAGMYQDVYGAPATRNSNQVTVTGPVRTPAIQYYTDATYARLKPAMGMNDPLYVQADAAACNLDSLTVESKLVTIASVNTMDTETFTFIETGPNTGVFRLLDPYGAGIATRSGAINPVVAGNAILETIPKDTLQASMQGCGAVVVQTNILVDPGGTVFDSSTGIQIPNVSVTLIDNATGLPATVLMFDAYTVAPSTVLTDAYGFFQFPLVAPGTYHLLIASVPVGYTYPSTVPLAQLPPQYTILGNPLAVATSGSYGGTFTVTPAAGPVVLDVPMDPQIALGLFTQKLVAKDTVELGAFSDYTVSVKNTLTVTISNINMNDILPHGFSYMPRTVRRDGVKVADPIGGRGPKLTFPVGTLAAGATTVFTYRARVGPGSLQGDGTNRAWAQSPTRMSNVALAKVTVIPGMLGDQAYLFGKVYMDCDGNRMQGEEEIGIPGVRLYLEDGTFAITDVEGKWSLYGLNPRTHVVKVDRISLPKDAELINLSNRHGGDPNSRFVDLKKGDWHRADFAVSNCTAKIRTEVYERRDQGQVLVSELQRNIHQTGIQAALPAGARSTIASGIMTPQEPVAGIEDSTVAPGLNAANSNLPESPNRTVMETPIEKRMPLMDNTFGFVDLHDGEVLPYRQSNVLVKGKVGSDFELQVNDTLISTKRVGKKSTLPSKQLLVWEYIGVDLIPGKNILTVITKDPFGNVRGTKTITVIAPGVMAQVRITVPESADADGHSKTTVLVELVDHEGTPVTVRTPLTLEASLGRWNVKDLNPSEPGVQVYMQGGKQEFSLLAPQEIGETKITVTSGAMMSTAQMDYLPALRPMIAVGVIEGRVQMNSFNLRNIMPVRQRDGFEEQLRLMSRTNGKREAAGRAAVFLKGRVLGKYLLTAAYDSDKTTKSRLFRDIQPDAYYPIYGDSAVKGFEAQSTTRLYVRVDHDRSWVLYGDFTTQPDAEDVRKLSTYNRTLTGVKQHYENSIVSVDSFATRDVSRQVVEELLANGTSGPFYIATTAMLINSEKLEVLTRDRNQQAVILQTTPLQRFADYQIEPMTGRIILAAPVPSLDANLNPQSIRVTYELDQGGKQFWTGGATGTVKIGDHLRVGATHVSDKNPLNKSRLNGVHAQLKLGETITASVEGARSNAQLTGQGNAKRAEIAFSQSGVQGRLYAGSTDVAFNNVSAYLNNGREEAGAEVTGQLTAKTNVKAQIIHTKDKSTLAQRRGFETSVNQQLGDWVKAELGYRQSAESQVAAPVSAGAVPGPNTQRSGRLKLASQVPGLEALGFFGEYERDLGNSGQRRAAFGGDYQMANQGKVYARHEFLTSNSGAFGLNNQQNNASTVFGIDTSYMKDGQLFSEYRSRDAISGRENQASIGLRNGWQVDEGLTLNTTLERIRVLNGPGTANSTTVSAGIEYTANPLLKASGRLEYHFGTAENSVLSTLGVSRKIDMDWSLLAKNTYSRRLNRVTSGLLMENRLQMGLAYRQVMRNHVHWLGMYELAHKRDSALGTWTQSHLLSTHVNVQPVQALTLTGRYAIKWLRDGFQGDTFKYGIQVASARAMVDITERWDGGIIGSMMYSNGFTTRQGGVGVETGYMLQANLWLSVGYNVSGFRDREGLSNQYTDQGVFMRLRYKFDENLFGSDRAGQ